MSITTAESLNSSGLQTICSALSYWAIFSLVEFYSEESLEPFEDWIGEAGGELISEPFRHGNGEAGGEQDSEASEDWVGNAGESISEASGIVELSVKSANLNFFGDLRSSSSSGFRFLLGDDVATNSNLGNEFDTPPLTISSASISGLILLNSLKNH